MCIISIFKRGKRPDKETVKRMMETNRDGVGIAWNTGRGVYFKKGFERFEDVEKFLKRLRNEEGVKDIIFHARIGTSGGISAAKCHPYPLSADAHQLNRTTYGGSAPVIFHNGVFSLDIEDGLNDSQTFIKNMLFPIYRADPRGLLSGKYDGIIDMAVHGSRLVIMTADGFRAYGVGWCEEDEAWYSNSGYKSYVASYYAWDDGEWSASYYDDDYFEDWQEYNRLKPAKTFALWRREKRLAAAQGGTKK